MCVCVYMNVHACVCVYQYVCDIVRDGRRGCKGGHVRMPMTHVTLTPPDDSCHNHIMPMTHVTLTPCR